MFEQEDKKMGMAAPMPPAGKMSSSRFTAPEKNSLEEGIKSALGAKPPIKLPEIHAMPEKLIGAPAGHAPVVRELVVTKEQKLPPPPVPKPPKKKKGNLVLIVTLVVVLLGIGASFVILYVPFGKQVPLANINANVNLNTNVNQNVNVNTNENVPAVNENVNQNVNENVNANVPPPPPRSGSDSDSDGLTDAEETTIYMSNPIKPDTDGDSFIDGNEVVHLFDPVVKAPASLRDSGYVRLVDNAAAGYKAIVPGSWAERGVGTEEYFSEAPTGEFIEILVTPKDVSQSIVDWYLAASPTAEPGDVERMRTYKGLDALRSADRLTAYIDAGDKVLTITYNVNDVADYEFLSTFEMVIASVELYKL